MQLADIVPLHLATVVFPDFHPFAGGRGVVRGYLLRHESGSILVDTGVGFGNANIDRWYQPQSVRIEDALNAAGVALPDVTAVVNSHLHFDHSGQNEALAGRPIYVQARELAAAEEPRYTIREWVNFPGASYVAVVGDHTLAKGVTILSTPGHTPGHQSVVVDTDEGRVVIAGQAMYSAAEFAHIRETRTLLDGDPPPDPTAYLDSALRIVDLEPAVVLFGHDEAVARSGGSA